MCLVALIFLARTVVIVHKYYLFKVNEQAGGIGKLISWRPCLPGSRVEFKSVICNLRSMPKNGQTDMTTHLVAAQSHRSNEPAAVCSETLHKYVS